MKNLYTKTIALRILVGLAQKVKVVRKLINNVIQVTYWSNSGWCSTFLSVKSFILANDQKREEAAIAAQVVEVIDDETFVVQSKNGNQYKVRPYNFYVSNRCECNDCYYRHTECKHQKAVKQFLNQKFELSV